MQKNALVTGGNSGIGYATAKLLKEKGYEVFISGRNPEKLQTAAETLGVEYLVADMADPIAIQALADQFTETGLDVLVSNAATSLNLSGKSNITPKNFSLVFEVNVRGPLLLIQELTPALEKRQGAITSVSSVSSQQLPGGSSIDEASAAFALYAASKGAVNSYTTAFAASLSSKKIRVNAVLPGFIDTPIFKKVALEPEELKETMCSFIPLNDFGTSEEVAQVIVSQLESTYVTGALWTVDGGITVV